MEKRRILIDDIAQLEWELANGCYDGYHASVIINIRDEIEDLKEQLDNLKD